jgi:hypothetical protein
MYDFRADYSINEIYHTWFANGSVYDNALLSTNGPAPGYVVGGPNKDYSVTTLSPPYGQPDSKSYLDFNDGWPNNSWEVSEPGIYYQAAYIRLLAGVIANYDTSLVTQNNYEIADRIVKVYPNPSFSQFRIESAQKIKKTTAFDVLAREIPLHSITNNQFSIEKSGIYFLIIELENCSVIKKKIIIKQ